MKPLLDVQNLTIRFPAPHHWAAPIDVVKAISFSMGRERLALVGESGSGKSMTARAILRLIQPPGKILSNGLFFNGHDLQKIPEKHMHHIRGKRISMVLQDPKFALNPVMKIGAQLAETLPPSSGLRLRLPFRQTKQDIDKTAHMIDMLAAVGIDDGARVLSLYPHQLSGGMGQRIMIAMMLASKPDLLIADEPTSALDLHVRAQVLQLINNLIEKNNMGLILISHDLHMVSHYCDRVIVMHKGTIVETLQANKLHEAQHPYTQSLMANIPKINRPKAVSPRLEYN